MKCECGGSERRVSWLKKEDRRVGRVLGSILELVCVLEGVVTICLLDSSWVRYNLRKCL